MKKLFLILIFLTGSVLAGISGLYFTDERNGEGFSLHCNQAGDCALFFFTYGALICDGVIEPVVSPSLPQDDCDLSAQRWFLGTGSFEGDVMVGDLTVTVGEVTYPDARANIVGIAVVVGEFTLVQVEEGFLVAVDHIENSVLFEDDSLYAGFLDGTQRLFVADG